MSPSIITITDNLAQSRNLSRYKKSIEKFANKKGVNVNIAELSHQSPLSLIDDILLEITNKKSQETEWKGFSVGKETKGKALKNMIISIIDSDLELNSLNVIG